MKTLAGTLFLLLSAVLITLASTDPVPLEIGSTAPDFSLPATDGKTYSLKDFQASRILLIVFTCNHCPTAQAYEDRIKQLASDYKSKGVAVVAISPNDPLSVRLDEMGYTDLGDSFEDMKIRAKDKQFNFPYLFDGKTSEVSMKYGPQATPHVFIFDAQRKLRYTGRIDDGEKPGTAKTHDTRNALDALLANKPVAVEKTKTFGCSIKWPSKRDYANAAFDEWAKEKVSLEELDPDQLKKLLANEGVNYKLINVWATWCGPCVVEFPHFVDMNRMYRNREFEMVTITLDDLARKQNALNFLTKKQASTKNYIFKGDKYAFIEQIDKKWEGSLPYTLFLAPGGKILYSKQGVIEPLELKKMIAESVGRIY
ncbi:redoxin domain-containing protein [Fulvivirgaceae bacterium PWU4]|uniref:Redoxin domain-containing protein n=1 Tax=Chryseosolibacter histidini TaxID=2782349 RepID=A0AAP2GSJ2_9BACT|nr:redoxin family protein [Chryseosolibacter histidini]MBT1701215.1 redoxin domain-containing protein [Chryseosolibacter histidini]